MTTVATERWKGAAPLPTRQEALSMVTGSAGKGEACCPVRRSGAVREKPPPGATGAPGGGRRGDADAEKEGRFA